MPGATPDITRRTFRIELARSIPVGILEALMATFAILFVLRIYRPEGDMEKVWLLGSSQLGLVASLFIVPLTFRLPLSIPRKMALSGAIATAFLLVSAVAHESLLVFTVCHCLAYFIMMMQTPLQTQLYQDNYPTENRGFLFGITSIVRGSSTVIFGLIAGMLLAQDLGYYRVLLWIFVAAGATATLALFLTPGKPAEDDGDRIPLLHSLRWVKEDPAFRRLLVSWMFMGLGNLVALRLWVEYLGNERFGLNFSEARIAYLTLALPFGCKLLTTFFWGRLFDRINFYLLRAILNMVFLAAILCVYVGGSYPWIFAGVILQGVAFGGGNIVWSLWVTKLAKPEHTSEYMSVHTFFTGIRGFAAPFVGFWILRDFGATALGLFSAVMITIATLIVLPDVRLGKARRPATMIEPRGPGV
ncbi:MAG: MFS transporter [Verrucomicrobiota bacterium]